MSDTIESATFELAVLRTELSNSATMLAHTQGFVGLLISAIAVSKYLESSWVFDVCGFFFVLLGFGVLIRGILLFRKTSRLIESKKRSSGFT